MNRTARLSIAAAATFVAVLAAKIWTYASGQDSATYMEIARGMQQWVREEPVLTHHLKLVAPVYPALLAVMRELGGPLVAYWVNPVICVVWLVLAAQLAARGLLRQPHAASADPSSRHAGRCRFLATDAPARFARVGAVFTGAALAPELTPEAVELVDL